MQTGWSWLTSLLFFLMFIIYPVIYPRMILSQAILKLRVIDQKIQGMLKATKRQILKKSKSRKSSKLLDEMLEFFTIEPTSLDPFGIIRKWDHILRTSEKRLEEFVQKFSPGVNEEELKTLATGIGGAIILNQIHKLINHYIGLIRKTKNLQVALLVQMQAPLIERIANSYYKGIKTILNMHPIGDGIGPMVAGLLIDKKDKIKEQRECIIVKKKVLGKTVFILRAKGPGARLGELGKVASELIKKEKIKKVITIDAAAKLEGEPTGSIAEGIGVAIGGVGIDKAFIEEVSTKHGTKLHAIVIKMSQEEAVKPMHPVVFNARKKVIEKLQEIISESKEKKVLIIGVGQSSGVPNTKEEIENPRMERIIKENWERYGKDIIKENWLDKLFGI